MGGRAKVQSMCPPYPLPTANRQPPSEQGLRVPRSAILDIDAKFRQSGITGQHGAIPSQSNRRHTHLNVSGDRIRNP